MGGGPLSPVRTGDARARSVQGLNVNLTATVGAKTQRASFGNTTSGRGGARDLDVAGGRRPSSHLGESRPSTLHAHARLVLPPRCDAPLPPSQSLSSSSSLSRCVCTIDLAGRDMFLFLSIPALPPPAPAAVTAPGPGRGPRRAPAPRRTRPELRPPLDLDDEDEHAAPIPASVLATAADAGSKGDQRRRRRRQQRRRPPRLVRCAARTASASEWAHPLLPHSRAERSPHPPVRHGKHPPASHSNERAAAAAACARHAPVNPPLDLNLNPVQTFAPFFHPTDADSDDEPLRFPIRLHPTTPERSIAAR